VRGAVAAMAALLVAVPFAIAGTFLLLPLWTWIETHWGIEAVGHASLAGWCFVATWVAIALPLAWLAYRAFRHRAHARGGASSGGS